jgi:hypothetical protein
MYLPADHQKELMEIKMAETVTQYVGRLLGYVADQQPLEILSATIVQMEQLISASSPDDIVRKPSADRWSAAEILAHLCDSEIAVAYRIRMIASANGCQIQSYDQNIWKENESYYAQHPEEAIEALKNLRKMNLAFLKTLPERKWNQYGIHEERGKETIRDVIRLYAGHDRNHFMQIEALLRKK